MVIPAAPRIGLIPNIKAHGFGAVIGNQLIRIIFKHVVHKAIRVRGKCERTRARFF